MVSKKNIFLLSNILIFFLAIFFFNTEYRFSPDVERNINFAKEFLNDNFNLKLLINNLVQNRSIEFNIIFTIFIYSAGLLIDNLPLVFFILNFSITLILFFVIKKDLKQHKVNIFYFHLFCYLFLLNPDLRLWQSFLLTDYFFTLLTFIYFGFMIKERYLILIFLIFCLLLIRPTSIFILPVTFLYIVFNRFLKKSNKFQYNFLIISGLFAFIIFSLIFINIQDVNFLGSKYLFYKDFNLAGIVIHDRWSVNYEIQNYLDLLSLFLIKFFSYHQFLSLDFSKIHNLYNLFYYLPYLLFISLVFKNSYARSTYYFNSYFLLSFYVFIIYSVCHSLLLIDFDWRYRMPLYIPFIISIVYFLHENRFYENLENKIFMYQLK